MTYYPNPHFTYPIIEGTYLQGQPNYTDLAEGSTVTQALIMEQNRSNRQPKPCKANLIRQIIRGSYCLKVDDNGVYFLIPYRGGPGLILETDMISPAIKEMVANYSNRDISEQSIRDVVDIMRREPAERGSFGTGRTWLGENRERYIALGDEVMMFPSGEEAITRPQQCYPYWHPINSRPYLTLNFYGSKPLDPEGLRAIEAHIALPKERELLVFAFMVLCMMPERQQLLLEITGATKSDMARLQRSLKNLVDPVIKETSIRNIPTTTKEVNKLAWRHQVLSLENVEGSLSLPVQRRLYELLGNSRLEWKATGCHENTTSLDVSRACLLSSLEPVITHPELLELTLSLELPSPSTDLPRKAYIRHRGYRSATTDTLPDHEQTRAFSALLGMLGKVHAKIDLVNLDRSVPESWHDFCRIGLIVSDTLTGAPDAFWSQYEAYRSERLCEMTEEEPVAQAIIKFLEINDITEAIEKPAGVWLAFLSEFRPSWASDSQWPREPRGLGAAFKRAAPLLDAQGITCYSNGKRGSKRHWVIGPKEQSYITIPSGKQELAAVDDDVDFWGLL